MAEKYRLWLTRNRLFDFNNCVCFYGEYNQGFDMDELRKAFRMLCVKEPLISCRIELNEETSEAFVAEGEAPCINEIKGESCEVMKSRLDEGLDFTKALFEFSVVNGKGLLISGHTTVCDGRALMYLAGELLDYYTKRSLSVEPSPINLLSANTRLPSALFSPVTEKLASDLVAGWDKKKKNFSCEDFLEARNKYNETKGETGYISLQLDKTLCERLSAFASEKNADASSLVAYAVYETLLGNIKGKKKYNKLNIIGNERVFFEDAPRVGPYNGLVTVFLKDKLNSLSMTEKAVALHKEIYKRLTSAAAVFYNEALFIQLPPAFCDSAYMYCAGSFSNKFSKKLALTYGCKNQVMGEFSSYNLCQRHWASVAEFDNIRSCEGLKMRADTYFTLVLHPRGANLEMWYRKKSVNDAAANKIMGEIEDMLEKF